MAFLRRVLPPTLQYRAASLLGERVQDWVVNRSLTGGRDVERDSVFSGAERRRGSDPVEREGT